MPIMSITITLNPIHTINNKHHREYMQTDGKIQQSRKREIFLTSKITQKNPKSIGTQ